METSNYWPGNVGDVGEHARANTSGNLADAFEVDDPRISRRATDEQFWLVLFGNALQLVIVNRFGLARDAMSRYDGN